MVSVVKSFWPGTALFRTAAARNYGWKRGDMTALCYYQNMETLNIYIELDIIYILIPRPSF